MARSLFKFERELLGKGIPVIAGVDEAGRGPWAGPVTAAAVILPAEWIRDGLPRRLRGLTDSKQLDTVVREKFFAVLTNEAAVSFAVASVESSVIDTINILRATHQAMVTVLGQLRLEPRHVLVDGLRVHAIRLPQTALVKGDALSFSIAAASVLAKVTRDRLMVEFDRLYPGYGFAEHKGYGTPRHQEALMRLGPCPIHRRSFAPLKPRDIPQLELF